ncbi:hypothetical protein [Companilactobacillus alimentarius]|nr:hypothetical protein [Companilactobacillus alimentarius]
MNRNDLFLFTKNLRMQRKQATVTIVNTVVKLKINIRIAITSMSAKPSG